MVRFYCSKPKSLLSMLFFFADHLQVSEIVSGFSLVGLFRSLRLGSIERVLLPSVGVVDVDPLADALTPI